MNILKALALLCFFVVGCHRADDEVPPGESTALADPSPVASPQPSSVPENHSPANQAPGPGDIVKMHFSPAVETSEYDPIDIPALSIKVRKVYRDGASHIVGMRQYESMAASSEVWAFRCESLCQIESVGRDGEGVLILLSKDSIRPTERVFLNASSGLIHWRKAASNNRFRREGVVTHLPTGEAVAGFKGKSSYQFYNAAGQIVRDLMHGVDLKDGPSVIEGKLFWKISRAAMTSDWNGDVKWLWKAQDHGGNSKLHAVFDFYSFAVDAVAMTFGSGGDEFFTIVNPENGDETFHSQNGNSCDLPIRPSIDAQWVAYSVCKSIEVYDRKTGKKQWDRSLKEWIRFVRLGPGFLLVATDTKLYLINPGSGDVWDQAEFVSQGSTAIANITMSDQKSIVVSETNRSTAKKYFSRRILP